MCLTILTVVQHGIRDVLLLRSGQHSSRDRCGRQPAINFHLAASFVTLVYCPVTCWSHLMAVIVARTQQGKPDARRSKTERIGQVRAAPLKMYRFEIRAAVSGRVIEISAFMDGFTPLAYSSQITRALLTSS